RRKLGNFVLDCRRAHNIMRTKCIFCLINGHKSHLYRGRGEAVARFSLRGRLNDAAEQPSRRDLMEERNRSGTMSMLHLIPAELSPNMQTLCQIGAVVYDDGLFGDALIARCAAGLVASGYRLGGVVQSNAHRRGRRRCDMYVKDLLGGDEIKISLDRG